MFKLLFKSSKNNADNKISEEFVVRIKYIQGRLEKVRQEFNMETDPYKIEALVYEEKALMLHLNHIMKTAKEQGIYVNDYSLMEMIF